MEDISDYLHEVDLICNNIDKDEISKVISILFNAWKKQSTIYIAGNGGSASTATHFVSDLQKYTAIEGKPRFRVKGLTENVALMTAITNDLGWENVYYEQIVGQVSHSDVYIAISVHGGSGTDKAGPWSQNLLKAARYVKISGGIIIGLSGFDGGILKEIADACIVVPVNSTPLVEGFHAVLTHLMVKILRQMIEDVSVDKLTK